MKNRLSILATVFLMVFGLGLLSAIPAEAGGGVDWQVTVKNPTKWRCTVLVIKVPVESTEKRTIPPGESTTFSTGALCPGGLLGTCQIYGKAVGMQATDMNGTPMNPFFGGASCWNHSMKICKKKGDDENPQEGDYSFCKD